MIHIEKAYEVLDDSTQKIEKALSIPLEKKIELWATPFENAVHHFYSIIASNLPLDARIEYYLYCDRKVIRTLFDMCKEICVSNKMEFKYICDNMEIFHQTAKEIFKKTVDDFDSEMLMVGQKFFNVLLHIGDNISDDRKSEYVRRVIMKSVYLINNEELIFGNFYRTYIKRLIAWIDERIISDVIEGDKREVIDKYLLRLSWLKNAIDTARLREEADDRRILMRKLGDRGIASREDEVL